MQENAAENPDTFEIAEGSVILDVTLDAGRWSLEQIAEQVNSRSKEFTARVSGGKMILAPTTSDSSRSISVFRGVATGYSMTSVEAMKAMAQMETIERARGNRHERRKAAALARKR